MAKQIIRNFYTRAAWLNYIVNRQEGCVHKCETCQDQWENLKTEWVHLVLDPDAPMSACGMTERLYCDLCIEKIEIPPVANPISRENIQI